jgi:hypothetical protein
MKTVTATTMLTAALEYAEHGVPVFPCWWIRDDARDCVCGRAGCENVGKHPIAAAAPNGFKNATTDAGTVHRWWTEYPAAHIGTPTSWCAVLDVDPRHAGDIALEALERQHGRLPDTAEVLTGGGGRHLYFAPVPGLRCSTGVVGVGLDIRANGGYVLLPPSGHLSGRTYTDEMAHPLFDTPLATMPPWLVARAQSCATQNGDGSSGPPDWAALLTGAPAGERHDVACRLAGHFLALLGPGRAEEVEEIVLGFGTRCSPPFPEAEARRIVRDLARKERLSVSDNTTAKDMEADAMDREAIWPVLHPDALHGLAGRTVRVITPYSEADPVAILATLLTAIGNVVGRSPHAIVEGASHTCNIYALLIGKTSKSRKGQSWGTPKRILRQVDETWAAGRIVGGLSSGEGLIYHVRDERFEEQPIRGKGGKVLEYQMVRVDQGAPDKRLLVIEPEISGAFRRMRVEANSLSAVLRQAYDYGDIRTLTKTSPVQATGAHISIVGHITEAELRVTLSDVELLNGFGNRLLYFLVKRSKPLPEGEPVPEEQIQPLARELREVVKFAGTVGIIRRDDAARKLWAVSYDNFPDEPGLVGAILARAEAHVLRLSLIYAVLDKSPVVRLEHLKAALALWGYAEASARRIFKGRTGISVADTILAALRKRGPLTREGIGKLFHWNKSADELNAALVILREQGKVSSSTRKAEGGKGRDAVEWRAVGD